VSYVKGLQSLFVLCNYRLGETTRYRYVNTDTYFYTALNCQFNRVMNFVYVTRSKFHPAVIVYAHFVTLFSEFYHVTFTGINKCRRKKLPNIFLPCIKLFYVSHSQ